MQLEDRPEFENLLAQLCAGFEVPVTKHRREAHWFACKRMTLGQYRKSVEFALGDDGPEDLPSPKAMRRMGRGQERATQSPPRQLKDDDHLEYFANRCLVKHLTTRGGLGPGTELQAALAAKRKIVDEFLGYVREGDDLATPAEFLRGLMSVMRRVSPLSPQTVAFFRAAMEAPEAQRPFPAHMARPLELGIGQLEKPEQIMDVVP